jgi:hypothetical protein
MWLHTVCTWNHIDGVVVSVIARIPVDREFEPRQGQTKDDTIGICCFSAEYTTLRNMSQRLSDSESE